MGFSNSRFLCHGSDDLEANWEVNGRVWAKECFPRFKNQNKNKTKKRNAQWLVVMGLNKYLRARPLRTWFPILIRHWHSGHWRQLDTSFHARVSLSPLFLRVKFSLSVCTECWIDKVKNGTYIILEQSLTSTVRYGTYPPCMNSRIDSWNVNRISIFKNKIAINSTSKFLTLSHHSFIPSITHTHARLQRHRWRLNLFCHNLSRPRFFWRRLVQLHIQQISMDNIFDRMHSSIDQCDSDSHADCKC